MVHGVHMSSTDLNIRDTWLHHLTVNKGLSEHSLRAYKVDSQGYLDYLHQNDRDLTTSQKNDVRGSSQRSQTSFTRDIES